MIQFLEIENFKSIRKQRVELGNLNILIGPNGAGKSNFISLFRFLKHLSEGKLEDYISTSGGIGHFLYKGFEVSEFFNGRLIFMENPTSNLLHLYHFDIISDGESYQFRHEGASYSERFNPLSDSIWSLQNFGGKESILKETAFSFVTLFFSFFYKHK